MLAQSPVAGDTRILREAASLAADGHRVTVVGRDVPEGFDPAGLRVLSVGRSQGLGSAARARSGLSGRLVRVARWGLLPEHRRRVETAWSRSAARLVDDLDADAVHAHDFNTLALGAAVARRKGAALVYDSHEFWTGRPRVGRPTPLGRRREAAAEARLGRLADAVVTVGDGVARALRSAYGWDHVVVVRNTFPGTAPSGAVTPPRLRGLVYAGRLAADRELEVVARASRRIALPVRLVGPADPEWLSRFDPGLATVGPALPVDEVDDVLRQAGAALVTHSDRWVNHRLALPNKLFHAVSVGVPVVATDVGELAAAVREHGLGTLYRPGDADGLVRAVDELAERYSELSDRVASAAPALGWSHDEQVLRQVYRDLGRGGRGATPPA